MGFLKYGHTLENPLEIPEMFPPGVAQWKKVSVIYSSQAVSEKNFTASTLTKHGSNTTS